MAAQPSPPETEQQIAHAFPVVGTIRAALLVGYDTERWRGKAEGLHFDVIHISNLVSPEAEGPSR